MKQIIKALALPIVAAAAFSCAKETPVQEIPVQETPTTENVKVVQFSTTPVTKTVFGTPSGTTLPTLWTDTYSVAVSLNYATAKKSTAPDVGAGSTTANFSAEIVDDESGAYKFIAVSPYDSFVSASSSYTSVQFNVPTAQTSLAASPDEKAQILLGQYDAGSSFPTRVTMDFEHLTAYGKISFSNLALEPGETVASVSLTASENWAGRYYYYVEDHSPYSAGDFSENSASATITITTDKTSDIWFGCAPVDLGGKTVDVVITTDAGKTYSKTITIPAGKKFTSGVVNAFTINMNGIAPDGAVVYTLVDDVADLTLGSEVILVGKGDDVALAMSTTQNTNNRGTASITKNTDGSGNAIISSPGVDVQVFTIENGNKAGTYAFSTGTGYIYAASSGSNWLRTEDVLSDNSSWTISVAADGEATILAIGDNTRNYMRCNSTNNPPIFSCYASTASTGVPVLIYKRNGTGSGAIAAKVPESLSISGATTSYTVDDSYEFDGTVTLVYSDKSTEVLNSSSYTVDDSEVDMSAAGTYTVTVVYNADNNITGSYDITVSDGGTPVTATLTLSSSKKFGTTSGSTLKDDQGNTWTVTTTAGSINGSYQSTYNGEQFGTSSTVWAGTFSAPITGTVSSVVVNANTGGSASLSVKVGTTSFKCNGNETVSVTKNTSSANSYEFTGSATGTITITLTGTSKACYFGGVTVTYTE